MRTHNELSAYEEDGAPTTITDSLGTFLGSDGFVRITSDLKDIESISFRSQDSQATFLVENGFVNVADPDVFWGAPKVRNNLKIEGVPARLRLESAKPVRLEPR